MTAALAAPHPQYRDYPEELMRSILPDMVVCGSEKDSYRLSCWRSGDKQGVRSISVDYALAYKFLHYSTTFKRHGKEHAEIIKTFIIDVDYKFKPTLEAAHKFVTDNIIPPTFTTQTKKGYQFIFGLASPFILTAAGEKAAGKLNQAIMDKFTRNGIKIDRTASSRLTGTFRNPLAHNFKYHNKLYNASELKAKLGDLFTEKPATVAHTAPQTGGINSKAIDQAKVIKTGYKKGNRNSLFYLHANRAVVLGNVKSYNETLMICRNVAASLSNTDPVPETEIKATARQLFKYAERNELFMPRVFGTGKKKANEGKYRHELNATVGYAPVQERRAAAMKMIHRDRKKATAEKIRAAVSVLGNEAFTSKRKVIKAIAGESGLSEATVKQYLKSDSSLLSARINTRNNKSKESKYIYVLDYFTPPPTESQQSTTTAAKEKVLAIEAMQRERMAALADIGYRNETIPTPQKPVNLDYFNDPPPIDYTLDISNEEFLTLW